MTCARDILESCARVAREMIASLIRASISSRENSRWGVSLGILGVRFSNILCEMILACIETNTF